MTTTSQNTLIIFGSLVGLTFVIIGGIIALVYSDGATATIVMPVLVAQLGPLIVVIMGLARSVENGQKADNVSAQLGKMPMDVAQLMQAVTPPPPPATPTVVVNTPPTGEPHGP